MLSFNDLRTYKSIRQLLNGRFVASSQIYINGAILHYCNKGTLLNLLLIKINKAVFYPHTMLTRTILCVWCVFLTVGENSFLIQKSKHGSFEINFPPITYAKIIKDSTPLVFGLSVFIKNNAMQCVVCVGVAAVLE